MHSSTAPSLPLLPLFLRGQSLMYRSAASTYSHCQRCPAASWSVFHWENGIQCQMEKVSADWPDRQLWLRQNRVLKGVYERAVEGDGNVADILGKDAANQVEGLVWDDQCVTWCKPAPLSTCWPSPPALAGVLMRQCLNQRRGCWQIGRVSRLVVPGASLASETLKALPFAQATLALAC